MTYFVTGATGTVGKHIVDQLVERGEQVRGLTRNPKNSQLPSKVEWVKGDLEQPETFKKALIGVDGLYLIGSTDKMGDDNLITSPDIITLAEEAGVKKVVLNAVYGDDELREAIQNSSLEWTFVQCSEFMANALEMNGWKEAIQAKTVIKEPNLNKGSALIHEEDIARVVVTCLLENKHHAKTYSINGKEAITVAEQLDVLSNALEVSIVYQEQTVEEMKEELKRAGASEKEIAFYVEMTENTPEMGIVPNGLVEKLTGKSPKTFYQWVEEHKGLFND